MYVPLHHTHINTHITWLLTLQTMGVPVSERVTEPIPWWEYDAFDIPELPELMDPGYAAAPVVLRQVGPWVPAPVRDPPQSIAELSDSDEEFLPGLEEPEASPSYPSAAEYARFWPWSPGAGFNQPPIPRIPQILAEQAIDENDICRVMRDADITRDQAVALLVAEVEARHRPIQASDFTSTPNMSNPVIRTEEELDEDEIRTVMREANMGRGYVVAAMMRSTNLVEAILMLTP